MSATQRARSGVPLSRRSVLPTVPGVPAWGAVAIAAAAAFVGFAIDAVRGSELTAAFSVFFFLGCLAAVLAVRNRGVFTAMVQPPLLLVVAVPLSYQFLSADSGGGLRDLLLNVAIPLVNRFPLMLVTTLVVVALGAGRMYIRRQASAAIARPSRRSDTGRRASSRARTESASGTDDVEQPRSQPPTRATRRTVDPAQPAHAPSSFTTGRYPTRSAHPEPAAERTDQFDREPRYDRPRQTDPQRDPRRADSGPQDRAEGYRYQSAPRHTGPAYPAGQGTGRHQYNPDRDAEQPMHPIPQVRYRDRGEVPQDPPYRYR
ncbi:DUF6542 domain-containing protein [Rhodococcus sp. NPDC003318]|uniref:DUF6542 domain-containing protein n=1 Tax=Rhodococcus sp. NPDC003318 TaxID=3364503 RepID=UPI0036C586B7